MLIDFLHSSLYIYIFLQSSFNFIESEENVIIRNLWVHCFTHENLCLYEKCKTTFKIFLMSDHDISPNSYSELRSMFKYYIDLYNTLYQLKTTNEQDLSSIYKKIKSDLIESKIYLPSKIMEHILNIIPFNNRYAKSYLYLAKLIFDDYDVRELRNIGNLDNGIYMFYKEYGIKLADYRFEDKAYIDIYAENTIYRAIMDNNIERFIFTVSYTHLTLPTTERV